jgi:hypothetical protein
MVGAFESVPVEVPAVVVGFVPRALGEAEPAESDCVVVDEAEVDGDSPGRCDDEVFCVGAEADFDAGEHAPSIASTQARPIVIKALAGKCLLKLCVGLRMR